MELSAQPFGLRALLFFSVSSAIVTGLFFWQAWQGFDLFDEGFLWYGAQRVMAGEVPLRDFQAYDPGRYYWSAALMALGGDSGIVALRASVAAFQVTGLVIALLLIFGSSRRPGALMIVLAAVTLSAWMYPRHKLFDITLSIALMAALAFLIRAASRKACFAAGVVVGLVAVFGRNHGAYGVAASIGVIAYVAGRENGTRFLADLAAWATGVAVGYLPMLAMIVLVPGFGVALWEDVLFLFEAKATNLPLPVPWPWLVPVAADSPIATAHALLVGLFFVAIPVFAVLGFAYLLRRSLLHKVVAPEFVSCVFLSIPYAHVAFSRADIGHLAQGIFPLLVGCFVAMGNLRAWLKWPLAVLLTAASVLVMLPQQPGWDCFSHGCTRTRVAGSILNVNDGNANRIKLLNELVEKYSPDGRSFVATPFWPAAYAMFGRKSPTWEIFALFTRSEKSQLAQIEQIRASNPGFVLVWDFPLDGKQDLRFRNARPLIDRFFRDNFDRLPDSGQNHGYEIYKQRALN